MRNSVIFLLSFFLFIAVSLEAKTLGLDAVSEMYQEGLQFEQLRMYPKAKERYQRVSNLIFDHYNKPKQGKKETRFIPLLISSGFRLSIVTAKDNYHNVYQLVHQIQSFQHTQETIDNIFKLLLEMSYDSEQVIDQNLYVDLFFSRAYNRIAWANKLLEGIAWKNYIVFPPNDVLGMVKLGVYDLEQFLQFQGFTYSKTGLKRSSWKEKGRLHRFETYEKQYRHKYDALKENSLLFQTKSLINSESDKKVLTKIEAKRSYHHIFKTLRLYHSSHSKNVIQQSKKRYTIQTILDKKNKGVFALLHNMVDLLGITI